MNILADFYKWTNTKAKSVCKWQIYYWLTGHRCTCKYHYSRILASALASSGGRYSVPGNFNPISSKTKHEMGYMCSTRRTIGKLRPYVANIGGIYGAVTYYSNGIPKLTFLLLLEPIFLRKILQDITDGENQLLELYNNTKQWMALQRYQQPCH